jgi:hypothetical protein
VYPGVTVSSKAWGKPWKTGSIGMPKMMNHWILGTEWEKDGEGRNLEMETLFIFVYLCFIALRFLDF